MTYFSYITRTLTLGLALSFSHAAWAQSDSNPITDDEIASAVAQYEALLAQEQALEEQAIDEPALIEEPIVEDAPLENLGPEDTIIKEDTLVDDTLVDDTLVDDTLVDDTLVDDTLVDDAPLENAFTQDAAIIDMASFRDTAIAQAKENGATAKFILNTQDSSQFQTLHEGLETDFHLTNVYQDYAENPEVSLDSAIETIVFLIFSAETHRFIAPDEAVSQPWLIETPESVSDEKTDSLPLDIGLDLLPGHTE